MSLLFFSFVTERFGCSRPLSPIFNRTICGLVTYVTFVLQNDADFSYFCIIYSYHHFWNCFRYLIGFQYVFWHLIYCSLGFTSERPHLLVAIKWFKSDEFQMSNFLDTLQGTFPTTLLGGYTKITSKDSNHGLLRHFPDCTGQGSTAPRLPARWEGNKDERLGARRCLQIKSKPVKGAQAAILYECGHSRRVMWLKSLRRFSTGPLVTSEGGFGFFPVVPLSTNR